MSSFVCFCVNLLGANTAQLPSVSMSFDLFTHVRIVFSLLLLLSFSLCVVEYSNKSVSPKNFVYDDLIADSDKL